MREARTVDVQWVASGAARRMLAVVVGALLVALGAQVAIPLPGTPVPVTLQVGAVLVAGGLLGPALGATSLALYLVLGAVGLPVFAPAGLPGLARLFGPTGGYLLALPLAAAVAGLAAAPARPRFWLVPGLLAAVAVIHAGGVAQLAILSGDLGTAWRVGSLPFLLGDLAKLLVAAVVIGRLGRPIRRALL
jgi:biotin transport system substrate-specific component